MIFLSCLPKKVRRSLPAAWKRFYGRHPSRRSRCRKAHPSAGRIYTPIRVAVPCFCGGPQERPCKKQTAFLLRLANFPGGRRSALVKIGALRQRRLPVSSTGRGRRRCPCSASPVSAAGSSSAAQPPALQRCPPVAARHPPAGGLNFYIFPHPRGAGIGFRARFSSIGIVSAKGILQLKSRRSSPQFRTPAGVLDILLRLYPQSTDLLFGQCSKTAPLIPKAKKQPPVPSPCQGAAAQPRGYLYGRRAGFDQR